MILSPWELLALLFAPAFLGAALLRRRWRA